MSVSIYLESAQNPLLKAVRRAARRGGLTADGLALAEGPHLLEEALRSGVKIDRVLLSDAAPPELAAPAVSAGVPLVRVADTVFRELGAVETSQGVLALVRPPAWTAAQALEAPGLVLALDRLQDPGNVGAIVRSAEAFGAGAVLLTPGCASPHNPKTLRASAGSLFRLPWAQVEPDALPPKGRRLYAAVAGDGRPVREVRFDDAIVVIGSEAHGVSRELLARAEKIHIPTRRVESLNAAMAATVILYEASRSDD